MRNRSTWSLLFLFLVAANHQVSAQEVASTASEQAPASSADGAATPEATTATDTAATARPAEEPGATQVSTIPVEPLPVETVSSKPEKVEKTDLQEVVVTATRRKQSLSKTPIAITEVSGAALSSGVVRDTQSVPLLVPSLVVTVSGNEAAGGVIRIRGVGTPGTNPGLEGSVGVFVDDVYLARPALAFSDLLDIDRIEVLRGPQGTLFGKNTSSGAITIHTRKPTSEPFAELSLSRTNFNGTIARGIFSGPLFSEKLGYRFAGQINERDGFIHNLYDGKDYNDRNRYSLRGQLRYEPSENATLRLIGGYYNRSEQCCIAPYLVNGPTTAQRRRQGSTVIDPPSSTVVSFDDAKTSNSNEFNTSAHLDWDLGWAKAKALLSYQKAFAEDPGEADFSDLSIVYFPFNKSDLAAKTAEFSLSGKAGWLDWVAGTFLSRENLATNNSILFGDDAGEFVTANIVNGQTTASPIPPTDVLPIELAIAAVGSEAFAPGTGQTLNHADQVGKNLSFFTHNVIDLGAETNLTIGLRYLIEDKQGGGFSNSNVRTCNVPANSNTNSVRVLCGAPLYATRYKDHRLTGTTGLSKSFGRWFVYGNYSSGFTSGGINLNPSTTTGGTFQFKPETVDAYELGLKVPFFDKKLTTRVAAFHMNFKNYQLNAYDGTAFVISNAGEVISQGVEFESTINPVKPLRISAGVTLADVHYGNTVDPTLRGRQTSSSPRWVSTLSFDYRQRFNWVGLDMAAFANLSARYQSRNNTSVSLIAAAEQPDYAILNGRIGMGLPKDLDISLFATNLTDTVYYPIVFNSVSQAGSFNTYPGPRRVVGVEFRKKF